MKKTYKILLFIAFFSTVHCTLNTEDCISQWTQLPNLPFTGTVYDMYFINENTGFVTLANPYLLLKTTNGGMNWDVKGTGRQFRNIQFTNDSVGYTRGDSSTFFTIMKSTDIGESWFRQYTTTNGIASIFFVNQDTGWACGSDGSSVMKIWRTTDGGGSFVEQFSEAGGSMQFIFFLSEKVNGEYVGWSVDPVVCKTTNSGSTWTEIYDGFTSGCGSTEDIYFTDTLRGVVVRGYKCINKTTDGGYNWSIIPINTSVSSKVSMGDKNIGWVTLNTDSVLKTIDFFQTHGKQPLPTFMGQIFALDTSLVYGTGGFFGEVLRTTNGGGPIVSSIEPISSNATGYELKQNYPNPFNPSTKIKFDIPKGSLVRLKVYDMLVREVAELVNEKLAAGVYEYEWSGVGLPSGVYFYKLEAEDFVETRRMVLVK